MEKNLNIGGNNSSVSGLTALQSLKHVTCSTPRMLNASEIKLLRQAKREIAQRINELTQRSKRRVDRASLPPPKT